MIHEHGEKRKHTKPQTVIKPLSETALAYLMECRRLTPETIAAYRLGTAALKGGEVIALPVYDEKGELQLVSFRHPTGGILKSREEGKDGEWIEKDVKTLIEPGGKSILFGSHLCDPSLGPLVICFGHYDAMTVYQDGIPNAVSIAFGDGDKGFFNYQIEFINSFSGVIIYNDLDKHTSEQSKENARKNLDELARRLGKHRVRLVSQDEGDRYGTKDASDLLQAKGEGFNKMLVELAEPYPVGVVNVATHVEPPQSIGVTIGIPEIDRVTNGFAGKQLVVVGGDNEAGKTTNVLNWMAHWINLRHAVLLFSGEQGIGEVREIFDRIAAGPDNIRSFENSNGFTEFVPLDERLPNIRKWYDGYFYQYAEMALKPEEFFEVAEVAVQRYGCRFIVVDNLMAFTTGEKDNLYRAQAAFVDSCKKFADKWDVTVILLCHIRKEREEKITKNSKPVFPQKDWIMGDKGIQNWADFIILMYRVPEAFRKATAFDVKYTKLEGVDACAIVGKNRKSGLKPLVKMGFDLKAKRFWQLTKANDDRRQYSWEDEFNIFDF